MPTYLITHHDYLSHDTGLHHPERPERLRSILSRLAEVASDETASPLNQMIPITPSPADVASITTVHDPDYVKAVAGWCQAGISQLPTGDTTICPVSYDVALMAAGGVMAGVDSVMAERNANAFCVIRPPGHHAGYDRGMGFCIFNSVAVGARYAQSRYGAERVLIIDWDVHHGNGTQHIFEADPSIYYISIHQYPLYPYTGLSWETGKGEGEGYTLNCPVSDGAGNDTFLTAFNEQILPAGRAFRPELIMVSAGFDAHAEDPLAGTLVTEEGFAKMTEMVMDLADTCCDGRLVSVLEGGYDLSALARSVESHLLALTKR